MRPRYRAFRSGPLACLWLAFALPASEAAPASDAASTVAAPAGKAGDTAVPLTESQRQAATVLKTMTAYLASLKTFSFAFRDGYDVVQSTGEKIEFGETRRILVARPDRLRVEEISSDQTHDEAVFDGKTISVFSANAGVYAQAPQPGSVDDALVYYVRDLRLRMPLALLLTTRLPKELPGRVKAIDYVELTDRFGAPAHHIAGRTDNVDFQFWIADGPRPLPQRVVITYLHATGQPQFWANFADWNTGPKLAADAFKFAPPKDAHQIPFAVQMRQPADAAAPAGNGEIKP